MHLPFNYCVVASSCGVMPWLDYFEKTLLLYVLVTPINKSRMSQHTARFNIYKISEPNIHRKQDLISLTRKITSPRTWTMKYCLGKYIHWKMRNICAEIKTCQTSPNFVRKKWEHWTLLRHKCTWEVCLFLRCITARAWTQNYIRLDRGLYIRP